MPAKVFKVTVHQNASAALTARVYNAIGEIMYADEAESITYAVFDTSDGEDITEGTIEVTDYFLNELTYDNRWKEDNDGFNALAIIPAEAFPEGNKTYRVQITINPIIDPYVIGSGEPILLKYDCTTIDTYSSSS